ncbi:hypothetical protein AK830_g6037 [Neonectria ditissima]|uniref:Uncharacterized protein n=1 Tax=Neonectria ditissima TaxID=78410 RepID=A0A0P7BJQ8_9HYPO|nr:hypothetical protein AK830_g6037 [Neonectria ditissima]
MASLVEVPADQITARYYGLGRYLELTAKGSVPSFVLPPFFQQEQFFGGLLYSIRAFSGGIPPEHSKPGPDTPFDITSPKLQIFLPLLHFNSKTVLVETAKGTWEIPITYIGWPGPSDDEDKTSDNAANGNINAGQQYSDVLPPIKESLLDGAQLKIVAQIPKTVGPAKAWVKASYNPTFFKLVDSTHEDGSITWTFEWAKLPTGPGESPQLIEVITTTFNGLFGASAITSKIYQGYVVSFVVLSDSK